MVAPRSATATAEAPHGGSTSLVLAQQISLYFSIAGVAFGSGAQSCQ